MNLTDRCIRSWYAILLLGLLLVPRVASAQLDDPGLEPTPSTKPKPPADKPATKPADKPKTDATMPPPSFVPPPSGEPVVHEEVKEEVTDKPSATMSDDEWEAKLVAPGLNGAVGLFRTQTAEVGQPLNFRVGLHMQAFTADSFLVAGSGNAAGDTNSRFLGDLTIGLTGPDVTFLRNLELYLAVYNSSNQNKRNDTGRTDPTVILALGDVGVGLKGAGEVTKGLSIGGNVGVRFFNSISGVAANFDATNLDVNVIGSLDLRKLASPNVPLRFHLNFGYFLDNSIKLLPDGQCAASTGNDACIRSRVVETFAYGLGISRLRLALAVEAPFRPHVSWGIFGVSLFVEYHYERALGDGDTTVASALLKDGRVAIDRIENQNIQYLTAGLRLRPGARLVIDLGADFGFQSPGFQFGPPLPAWNIVLGAAYTYDTAGSSTKLIKRSVTKTIEVNRTPPEGRLRGVVRDAKTKKPIAGAIVTYQGRQLSPQATGADGVFLSYGLPAGPVVIEVAHGDEYEPATVATSVELNTELPVDVTLKAKPPKDGKVHVKLSDEKNAPIVGASVRFVGPATKDATPDGDGMMAALPAGDYDLSVDAPGYLAKEKQVTVAAGTDQTVDLQLHKRPAISHVQITKDQIVIKGTIHFGTNNATILPDGQQLLDEVADVLAKNPQIRKVSVEGHTDNRGNGAANLKLSTDRAAAVVEYLTKTGIGADRLTSVGYGATRPLVPNLTPANRAKNRRVEFKILDQGAGAFPQ
jgi:outer membrane protein OmpA-like peptidoglycan-associated protein